MTVDFDEDEIDVLLDALASWRERADRMYEPGDRKRYIAAANRALLKIDPIPNEFNSDGHQRDRKHADY